MNAASVASGSGYRAVIFDLGGVILTSPLSFIRNYERERGLPEGLVARLLGGYGTESESPWHALERGELLFDDFCPAFDALAKGLGHDLDTRSLMLGMSRNSRIQPVMVSALRELRAAGYRVAALTNIWATPGGMSDRYSELGPEFDEFIESYRVGLRKPETAIFELAFETLGIEANEAVFLDDIGANLKVGRQLGLTTIKVTSPEQCLTELQSVLGMALNCLAAHGDQA